MITRRTLLTTGAAAAALTVAPAARADDCMAFSAEMQAAITPQAAVEMLKHGNARFLSAASLVCDLSAQRQATAPRQTPFACVLGCIDSRVPPELVFDQQIGDLFVARVAGNVPNPEILGSFEYATKVAGAKAIVVLGHTHCGAVKGAIDRANVGDNLTVLLSQIEPAVDATPLHGERASSNHHFVEAVARTNVQMAVAAMTEHSPVLADLVAQGQLVVVGAVYDIDTGVVSFLEGGAAPSH